MAHLPGRHRLLATFQARLVAMRGRATTRVGAPSDGWARYPSSFSRDPHLERVPYLGVEHDTMGACPGEVCRRMMAQDNSR
jgi:hypothetical protein